jgi:N-acetylglucosamine-6-phosphate deacetylase
VRLADGTLAGSTLTMDRALRNLVTWWAWRWTTQPRRVSTYAADFLGSPTAAGWPRRLGRRGVLDRDLRVQEVFVEGGRSIVAHAR